MVLSTSATRITGGPASGTATTREPRRCSGSVPWTMRIGVLVTRNTRDHPEAAIQIVTPADFLRLHASNIAEDHTTAV